MHELEVEKEPMLAGDLLHKMFAKKMIQELAEEPQNSQTEKELIRELSLMYNIISPFTSFICVDDGHIKSDVVGDMQTKRVENMMPGSSSNSYGSQISPAVMSFSDEELIPQCDVTPRQLPRLTIKTEHTDTEVRKKFYPIKTIARSSVQTKTQKRIDNESHNWMKTPNSKTLHENMMALIALQSASGHFVEHKIIGDIIGKPLEELKAQVPDSKPESLASWITAIVIAFLELKCLAEKDLWEMIVEKAKAVVLDFELIEKAKNIVTQL